MNKLKEISKREKILNRMINKENYLLEVIKSIRKDLLDGIITDRLEAELKISQIKYAIEILQDLRTEIMVVLDNE